MKTTYCQCLPGILQGQFCSFINMKQEVPVIQKKVHQGCCLASALLFHSEICLLPVKQKDIFEINKNKYLNSK